MTRLAAPPVSSPGAWKELVGDKPVAARLALLPDTQPRMGAMGVSLLVQISLAVFTVMIPLLYPQVLAPQKMYMVTEVLRPSLHLPPPPPKPQPQVVRTRVEPPPPTIQPPPPKPNIARIFAPRIEAPKPKVRQLTEAELPKVNETFQPVKLDIAAKNEPARPREPVKTGVMTNGSSAPATINKPIALSKVQTGGFGDPEGLPGPGNPSKRANINQFGSPALPAGPGYGNGTGGANGVRGTVASAGFGDGVAIVPSGRGRSRGGAVQSTGFADQNEQVVEAPKAKTSSDTPAVQPVEILAKPRPAYTAEALKLNLEGEVLLEVVFPAAGGQVQVNRVIKGLGHGLDEAATRAAQQIKFKPALSGGRPVDFPAVVHIVFQMAY